MKDFKAILHVRSSYGKHEREIDRKEIVEWNQVSVLNYVNELNRASQLHGNTRHDLIDQCCDTIEALKVAQTSVMRNDLFNGRNARDVEHLEKLQAMRQKFVLQIDEIVKSFEYVTENL